jgi:hypothetical protein
MGGAGSSCLFLRVPLCAFVVYIFGPGCFCPQITRIVQIFTAKERNVHEGRSRERLFIPSCTFVRLRGFNFRSGCSAYSVVSCNQGTRLKSRMCE